MEKDESLLNFSEKPDYIIRKINRNSLYFNNRKQQFISFDENNNVVDITDLGTLDSETIICDGCNSLIKENEIITLFSFYDGDRENISRAECSKCYKEYFEKDFKITSNPLFNVCSEIVFTKQYQEYKGTLIDLQSANLYCKVFNALNHVNRVKAESMENMEILFGKLWSLVK